jgi:hypothetical protein
MAAHRARAEEFQLLCARAERFDGLGPQEPGFRMRALVVAQFTGDV